MCGFLSLLSPRRRREERRPSLAKRVLRNLRRRTRREYRLSDFDERCRFDRLSEEAPPATHRTDQKAVAILDAVKREENCVDADLVVVESCAFVTTVPLTSQTLDAPRLSTSSAVDLDSLIAALDGSEVPEGDFECFL